MNQPPSQTVSRYPFKHVEGNLFPPVCLRSHWDPTQMLKRTLPGQKVGLPMDFRPLVKVCKNYVTSAPPEMAPEPPANMVFPMGGSFYPPTRYAEAIDQESSLRTLDHRLDRWCTERQYIPSEDSTMYVAGSTVPDRQPISNTFVSELSMPKALLRQDMNTCRTENDRAYMQRSSRLFGNPTKQDRYGAEKYYALPGGHKQGYPMPHGGVPYVRPTKQAMTARQMPNGTASMAESQLLSAQTSGTSFVGTSTAARAAPVW
jgi:hypothetical protein